MEESWKRKLYDLLDDAVNMRSGDVTTSSTCISCALEKGYEMLKLSPKDKDKRMILISDGFANDGKTEGEDLQNITSRALKEEDVRTTTIGVNPSCNDVLLRTIADAGNGNHYINDGFANISSFFHDEFENITKTPINHFYFVYRSDFLQNLSVETELKQREINREEIHDIIVKEKNYTYDNVSENSEKEKKERKGILRKEKKVEGVSVSVTDIREVRDITIKGVVNIDNYKKEQGNIFLPHYMEVGYFVFTSSLHCDDETDNEKIVFIPFRVLLKASENIGKCKKSNDEKFLMCYSTYRNSILGGCDPEKAVTTIPHCEYILPNCTDYFNSLLKTNLLLEEDSDFDCKQFLAINKNNEL
jgi:hypothetical protein